MSLSLCHEEKHAIQLAKEINANLILLDDENARVVAKAFRLNYTGTLGIILNALEKGLIKHNEFPELMDALIKNGFRMSIELYNEVIKLANGIKAKHQPS